MSTHKYVYPRPDMPEKDGKVFVNVHYLIGYNGRTVSDYLKMADVLAETFPEATAETVNCSIVTKSSCVQSFSLAIWNGYVAKDHDYKDWHVWSVKKDAAGKDVSPNPDYYWA